MDAYEVLVIILSVALAIFLILAITVIILMIIILKKIKRAADSAQQIVENVESYSSTLLKTSGPVKFIKTIVSVINGLSRKERG